MPLAARRMGRRGVMGPAPVAAHRRRRRNRSRGFARRRAPVRAARRAPALTTTDSTGLAPTAFRSPMNLVYAALIVAIVTATAVALMLLVRRRAPDGSYFADGDRASGVFGVLATGFSVLLGFIVFLAFTSYDSSRAGAENESVIVAQQIETAQLFDDSVKGELTGELLCYGRSVAGEEWDRMQKGTLGDTINPWSAEMFRTVGAVDPQTATQQSAYDKWLDQTSDREQARNDRVHAAAGVIPLPLWLVLFFISIVIFFYMLFFADRGERAVVQAMLMGIGRGRALYVAAPARVPQQSVSAGRGRAAADRDGADPAHRGSRAGRCEARARHAAVPPGWAASLTWASIGDATPSRYSQRCSSRSQPSRLPGAATRRPAGTASRQRRRVVPMHSGSMR